MSEELHDELDDYQDDIEQDIDTETDDDEQDIDDSEQDAEQDDSEADDSLDYSFDNDGEESDPFAGQKAPEWVKKVREENRELKRQQREWQQQQGQSQQQGLREKPTLDAHDYDSDAYEQDYAQWLTEKTQHDTQVQSEVAKRQQYYDNYQTKADTFKAKAPDYMDAEESVVSVLSNEQQTLLMMMTDDPAKMVYTLGKNSPTKLSELAQLDVTQFAKQIVLMEANMSNVKRNPNKPKPKSHTLEGQAGGGDRQLDKLEADAEKTGDRSAIVAYRKKMRNK